MTWRSSETKKKTLEVLQNETTLILFDVETTGLKPQQDRIIQISGIKFSIINGNIVEVARLDQYINPEFPLPKIIVDLTGITDESLKDKPTENVAFYNILRFFENAPNLAAYNSSFDVNFLKELYQRQNERLEIKYELDILKMAKDIIPPRTTINYKLGTIAEYYGVNEGLQFHSAIDDVIATSRIFTIFIQEYLKQVPVNSVTTSKLCPTITDIRFWNGYSGFSRIYINTNMGSFYYDIRGQYWGEKIQGSLEKVDMETFLSEVYKIQGVATIEEFISSVKGV